MLEDYWYIAMPSRMLRTQPKQFYMFGKPVVLARLEKDVVALEDRCAHRNVMLSKGKICGNRLTCPYHGWEYDKNGHVAAIPTLGDDIQPNIQIPKYACAEQDGYIWVCIGTPLTPKPDRLPYIDDADWVTFRERAYFKAGVVQVLENFLDIPHAIYVHTFWFRQPLKKKITAIVRTLSDGVEAEIHDEPRDKGVLWRLISRKHVSMKHSDRFIAPATSCINYIFSDGRHYVVSSYCTPVNEHETQVHTIVTFKAGNMRQLIKIFLKPLAKLLIWQDIRITQQQELTIQTFDGKPRFNVTRADLLFPHIQRWRQAIKAGTPPPEAGKEIPVEICL